MSTGDAGTGVPLGSTQATFPVRMLAHSVAATASDDTFFTNSHGGVMIVQCVDAVASQNGSSTPQLAVYYDIAGHRFYFDSQSIGEGEGIRFTWRGGHVLRPGDQLGVHFYVIGAGVCDWSVVATGVAGPFSLL